MLHMLIVYTDMRRQPCTHRVYVGNPFLVQVIESPPGIFVKLDKTE